MPTSSGGILAFKDFELHLDERLLSIGGQPAHIGARAYDLLVTLVERRERVVGKHELLDLVWPKLVVEENNLQVHIHALRKLLGPAVITTVPGRGYRFTAEAARPDGPGPVKQLRAARTSRDERRAGEDVDAPSSNLPDYLPALYGRELDLRAVRSLLETERLVTITGAGGIGKTRLAQAVAHDLRGHFQHGTWMLELAWVHDETQLVSMVAQMLGLTLPGRGTDLDELATALRSQSLLLVLDNCEHLLEAVGALVFRLLCSAPSVRVLVTSQELLRVAGEYVHKLAPLAVPVEREPGLAMKFGAVRLFVERARALDRSFELDERNVDAVVDICARLDGIALAIELADALLLGRQPALFEAARPWPGRPNAAVDGEDAAVNGAAAAPSPDFLARSLVSRVGHIHDEIRRMIALARGDAQPDLAVVRATWQLFISPTSWSWRPFVGLWRWDAPPLRHAIRAALAIAIGEAISLALPWGTHDYWILLTVVVVLRGSLAQTLERRNSRVAGTLLGCLLAAALLAARTPPLLLMIIVTLAQGVAHAFAIRRYLVTAVAATVLALLQAHLLNAGTNPAFDVAERLADTLIGTAIAWAFSYVLPSWERTQIPALIARTILAQARHARVALGLGQLRAVDNDAELAWRLARREVYDSLSALVQATQRSLSEPRAVRPPLEPLGRLLAHSYQLLAQLTSVKTMLLLRRDRLDTERIRGPLRQAAETIGATLSGSTVQASSVRGDDVASPGPVSLPDPSEHDLNPWLLRRLQLAADIAQRLRSDAQEVLEPEAPDRAGRHAG